MFKELQSTSTTKVTKAEGTLKRLKLKIRTVSLFLSLKNSKKLKRDRTFVTFVVQQILKNPKTQSLKNSNTQTLKTHNPHQPGTNLVQVQKFPQNFGFYLR